MVDDSASRKIFIAVRDLHKSFEGKKVLKGVNLEVFNGETLVILGGSGSGKSVLLRHFNGLLRPDRGQVVVDGDDLSRFSEEQMAAVRRKVGIVFQQGALFDSMSVFDNVAYPLREQRDGDEGRVRQRVEALLQMVELPDAAKLFPAELSGGMKKRIALARTIAIEPRCVLYDEPTTGLDPIVAQTINSLIRDLQRQLELTSVVVTHDIKSAFAVGDRFALLGDGVTRFVGTQQELRTSDDQQVKEFLTAAL